MRSGIQSATRVTAAVLALVSFSLCAQRAGGEQIWAFAAVHGAIVPPGLTEVDYGSNMTYRIIPDHGYAVSNVLVDGGSEGPVTNYTFVNVITGHTIVARFQVRPFAFTVASAHGSAVPGVGTYSNYAGTMITNAVVSPDEQGGVLYECTGWTMTGNEPLSGSMTNFVMTQTNDAALTWTWTTNYMLDTTAGAHGSVDVLDDWKAAGSVVPVTGTADPGYHFASWSGDTNDCTITANRIDVLMDRPRAVTALFSLNLYAITATAGANGTISPSGAVMVGHGSNQAFNVTPAANYHISNVVVDSVSQGAVAAYVFTNVTTTHSIDASFAIDRFALSVASAHGTPVPGRGTWTNDYGTGIGPGVNSPDVIGTTQYVCTGWAMAGNAPLSGAATNFAMTHTNNAALTWTWTTNYMLDTTAGAHGSVDVLDDWKAAGSVVPVTGTADPGYHFTSWSGDTNDCTITGNRIDVLMDRARVVTASFALNLYAITATAGANGTISPSGAVMVGHGSNQAFNVTPAANYHISNVLVDSVSQGAVAAYVFTNVTTTHSIDASFAIDRYTLTIVSAQGNPIPGVGVVTNDYGKIVSAFNSNRIVNGTTQYLGAGWVMTGNEPQLGSETNFAMTHTNDAVLVWRWSTNYWINVTEGLHGRLDTADGWLAGDFPVTIMALPDTGYHLVSWSGDTNESTIAGERIDVMMDRPKSITATFALNMYTIDSSSVGNGTITPPGTTVVGHGSNQTYNMSPSAFHHVEDVLVDGLSAGAAGSYPFNSVVTNHTIQAAFHIDQRTLQVRSPYGPGVPPVGMNTNDYGTNLSVSMTSPVAQYGTQYFCIGWVMTGNSPLSGSTNYFSMTLTNNGTLAWRWSTNYILLNMEVSGSGTVTQADAWLTPGTAVTNIFANAEPGYYFSRWSGDTNGCTIAGINRISIPPMSNTRTITAVFLPNVYSIDAVVNGGVGGTISPSGSVALAYGASQAFTIVSLPGFAINQLDVDWTPVSITNYYVFTNVTTPRRIEVYFVGNQISLRVNSQHGDPQPSAGLHSNNVDTAIDASVTNPDMQGGAIYTCLGWTMTGNEPLSGTDSSFPMIHTNHAVLSWRWQTNYYLHLVASAGGWLSDGDSWPSDGDFMYVTATPDNEYYYFDRWSGDTGGCVIAANQITAIMSQPRNITGEFKPVLAPAHGTPVIWLRDHGMMGDPATEENSDYDSDLMAAWKEYVAGTDPEVKLSCLTASATGVSGTNGNAVSFESVVDKVYKLSANDNLMNTSSWVEAMFSPTPAGALAYGTITGVMSRTTVYVDRSATNRAFRIRVEH